MSLITRCPNCLTTFRVVPDQLRISEGWVRCGQCQHVFDANAALVASEAAAHPIPAPATALIPTPTLIPEDVPVPREPVQPAKAAGQPVGEFGAAASVDLAAIDAQANESPASSGIAECPAGGASPIAESSLEVDLDLGLEGEIDGESGGDKDSDINGDLRPTPVPTESAHQLPSAAVGENVSFMRRMPQKSSWQRSSFRAALALLALVLLAALGIQVAVQERDRMAALLPQAKPALQWVCQRLNCTVSNLRQIESVVIDSSSFNKIRPDAYRLGIVLRNTSTVDIAMPALELTLTDSRDQPVMRRVLQASEFSPVEALGAASDWTGSVAITVRGNGSDRFSGYKVLAFYP